MSYICKFCENKFSTKKVEIVCPVCGEDYFIEKFKKENKSIKIEKNKLKEKNNP